MISDELKKRLIEEDPFTDILGQNTAKAQVKAALLMGRNIIIAGPPGVGKTTLAKNIARLLPKMEVNDCGYKCSPEHPACPKCISNDKAKEKVKRITVEGSERFVRIQGSPDLTAEDLIGDIDPIKALKFGGMSLEAFTPGKIFKANNGVLFFDELNRCPEKLQNALLQVLEEKKMTVAGYDLDFDINFVFIGTMNPDDSSTEPLSNVFLDRFDIVYMDYPENVEIEEKIVRLKGNSVAEFPNELLHMTLSYIKLLRDSEALELKPSVRASLGLYEMSQSNAIIEGRQRVTVKDIEKSIIPVLTHRIRLKPSIKYLTTPEDFLREQFAGMSQQRNSHSEKKGDYL
jgi:magnesium chelatase subunit I